MNLAQTWVVFQKELLDNLRDRRTLAGALFTPLLGPILIAVLFSVLGSTINQQSEQMLRLPVQGAENAPNLMVFLRQNDVAIEAAPPDARTAVQNGDLEVVLIIPETYGEAFTNGQPAAVQLVVDESRQSASVSISRTRRLLQLYSQQMAAMRLLARGIDPSITQAIAIETLDVSTPQSQAANLLNLTPYFIIFSVFIGGMYLAIDSTAGERERGSLEPLLINPVARWQLVFGKLLATMLFATVALLETLVGFAVVLNFPALTELVGVPISLPFETLVGIFFISLPMILLASALQLIIATFTRSFKEAQNYMSFLPLIPALPGMFLAFVPVKPALWHMLIPTFGQQLLINQAMRGETLSMAFVFISAGVTLLCGAAFVWAAIRLYNHEKILFGSK